MNHGTTCSIVLVIGALATTAAAQPPARADLDHKTEELRQALTSARTTLETRVTPGAPYSAEAITEFVQLLADGNRITRKTMTRVYRDVEGRTRRETLADNGEPTEIAITDPVANWNVVLHPATKTMRRGPAMFANVVMASRQPSDGDRIKVEMKEQIVREPDTRVIVRERQGRGGPPASEDLGQQNIEGVVANGTRTTTTIPAGAIGNEQPLVTVSEQWFSQELRVLVLTRHNDPRVGETVYRLSNIRRGEPDRSLFQVPSDYTVKEMFEWQPMKRQQ